MKEAQPLAVWIAIALIATLITGISRDMPSWQIVLLAIPMILLGGTVGFFQRTYEKKLHREHKNTTRQKGQAVSVLTDTMSSRMTHSLLPRVVVGAYLCAALISIFVSIGVFLMIQAVVMLVLPFLEFRLDAGRVAELAAKRPNVAHLAVSVISAAVLTVLGVILLDESVISWL